MTLYLKRNRTDIVPTHKGGDIRTARMHSFDQNMGTQGLEYGDTHCMNSVRRVRQSNKNRLAIITSSPL